MERLPRLLADAHLLGVAGELCWWLCGRRFVSCAQLSRTVGVARRSRCGARPRCGAWLDGFAIAGRARVTTRCELSVALALANCPNLPLLKTRLDNIPPRLEVRRQRLLHRARRNGCHKNQILCLDLGIRPCQSALCRWRVCFVPHIRSRGQENAEKQRGKQPADDLAFVHLACANFTLNGLFSL